MSIFDRKNTIKVNKTFSYSKNKITLSFNLDTNNKYEMKDFLKLLKVAILEVDNEIKTLTPEQARKLVCGGGAN